MSTTRTSLCTITNDTRQLAFYEGSCERKSNTLMKFRQRSSFLEITLVIFFYLSLPLSFFHYYIPKKGCLRAKNFISLHSIHFPRNCIFFSFHSISSLALYLFFNIIFSTFSAFSFVSSTSSLCFIVRSIVRPKRISNVRPITQEIEKTYLPTTALSIIKVLFFPLFLSLELEPWSSGF